MNYFNKPYNELSEGELCSAFKIANKMAFAFPLTNEICIRRDNIMTECMAEFRKRGMEIPYLT